VGGLRGVSIPAFSEAKRDRALRGAPIVIYLALLDTLTIGHWRELPQLALCHDTGYSERTVRGALRLLTRRGYLEQRPVHPNAARKYRLEYARRSHNRTTVHR
jgi:DNA-binding transcriptional regulator PaaX